MAEIQDLNILAANNTGRFPEGMQINQYNDSARELEAILARWQRDVSGNNSSSGTGAAYAVTTYRAVAALSAGFHVLWKAHVANTGACTLAVSGLATKPLKRMDGSALEVGDIAANQMICAIYDPANDWFQCLGIQRMVLPTYTVATLPTSGPNLAIASNGRKNGEGAGVGTGVMSFRVGTSWFSCDTGATTAA